MTARRGVIIHAGDIQSCDLAKKAAPILRDKGWAIRCIDRSRTRRFADTLLVAASGAWHNCRLVELDLAGNPISAPIPIIVKRKPIVEAED